ncbi:MAG: quinolinate synthase NadA [Candidatus Aureabacteria bacterium]|nr:quinolinate synthase NadA [Candidatus Auribacterota bacterium]
MVHTDIVKKIQELKARKNVIILVHNYQLPEVQDIADFLGDSLDLSRKAAEAEEDVIVFCGVHFMAETAAILSPSKTVLIPDPSAGCPMADMLDVPRLRELKKKHPEAVVVTYVNSTADVKAESDICCTSANAEKIVRNLDVKEIIFGPDKYLGGYVARQTGKNLILWQGYCIVHMRILPEDIKKMKNKHPNAEVLVHPECTAEVVNLADNVLSTTGMCRHVKESASEEFIIGTEVDIIYRLQKENPCKKFYPATELSVCHNMKKISLDKVLRSLETMSHVVKVEERIRERAKKAIDKMLEYSRAD